MSNWEGIDPTLLVNAYNNPVDFIHTILPHFPFELSPKQKFVLNTFYDPLQHFTELLLCAGRKGGKSVTTSIIPLYEVFRLLLTDNLHKKYNLIPDQPIYIMCVSTSYEQALGVIFQYICSLAQGSWYLSDQIVNITKEEIEFNKRIKIRCQPCSSRSGLGFPTWMNIYDEHAHMLTRQGNAAGDVVYDALQPNLKVFKGDGRSVTISTPAGMEGIFWDLFSTGEPIDVKQHCDTHGANKWRCCFQYATWELNSSYTENHPEMVKEKLADPANFDMQYGALFSTILQAALQPNAIDDCAIGNQIDENLIDKVTPRAIVLDPATVGADYAVAMGHLSESPKKDMVIIDLIKTFEGSHKTPVNIGNVEDYARMLCRNFNILYIGVDQHQSSDTIQKFQAEGLPIHLTNITPKYNMDMYSELFRRINTKHIIFPNDPVEGMKAKEQLRFLQKKYVGWGFKVEAARGHLDDVADCMANLCLILSQQMGKRTSWSKM